MPKHRGHYWPIGGKERWVPTEKTNHIPPGVVEYVAGLGVAREVDAATPETSVDETPILDQDLFEAMEMVRFRGLRALPE